MSTTAHPRAEELANSLSHALGALASVIAFYFLYAFARRGGDPYVIFAYVLFGASLILLFSASSIYHAAREASRKKRLQVFDHASIYALIAGTYSAFCLTALRGKAGWIIFAIVWTMALVGIVLALFFTGRFKILSTLSYIVMGWVIVFAFGSLKANLRPDALVLLMTGGGLYTVGAVVYAIKRIPWNHPIWHLFVLGGATCHVLAALKAIS